jgi:hypothetical protein
MFTAYCDPEFDSNGALLSGTLGLGSYGGARDDEFPDRLL